MPMPAVVLLSAPVLCWIVPPVQSATSVACAGETEPPQNPLELPVTVRPPLEPVVSRTMPLPAEPAPVPALMLRNVKPLAPMVVLVTLSAVPVVDEIVLTMLVLFCVALTVAPLPEALKPTPLVVVRLSP